VAFGEGILLDYRLHWTRDEPYVPAVGTVRATRQGKGGILGQPRLHYSRKFVVDFAGGTLADLGAKDGVQPVVDVSRGIAEDVVARPLKEIGGWRAEFDLRPDGSQEPIDLRLYLRQGDRALTETWVYQWFPVARRRG
jgi:glucans biosynthesis protein